MGVTPNLIEGEQLTTWAILTGGTHERMEFVGADGTTRQVVLPFEALSSLLMTLPRMLQTALDARFADGSLRFVQPIGSWRLERAESDLGLILRLGTRDSFEIAFAWNGSDADPVGAALLSVPDTSTSRRPN
jgi:hypothetical protein